MSRALSPDITVITPTVPGRETLLNECVASVEAVGLKHLVQLDVEHKGPVAVRNRLIQQVATKWTLFLDDDDLLYPGYLTTVRAHLATADVVYTAWDLSGADEPQPHPWFDAELLLVRNFIPVTACVRTVALRAVGGFPDARFEDHELWKLLLARGYRFTYVPVVAWCYRRFPGSRSEMR